MRVCVCFITSVASNAACAKFNWEMELLALMLGSGIINSTVKIAIRTMKVSEWNSIVLRLKTVLMGIDLFQD